MAKYVGKRIVPKHCGYWDNTKPYEMECIVYDRNSGNSYISRKAVPAGTDISQEEYWALCSDFNMQMALLDQHITESEAAIKADNDATEAAIRTDNDATEHAIRDNNTATQQAIQQDNAATRQHVDTSLANTTQALTSRVSEAETAMTNQKNSFDQTAANLNTRMDAVLRAGTGDAQTEVRDARVDAEGEEHESLGEAIRQGYLALKEELENLRSDMSYSAIAITSFTASPAQAERGSTVAEVTLAYVLNVKPASVQIDGADAEAVRSGSVRLTGQDLRENKTWTLVAKDSGSASQAPATATKAASLTFLNRVYFGAAAAPSAVNSAFLLGLANAVLTNTKARNFTVNAGAGQHIWYAVPARLGACAFKVGGFDGGFTLAGTISHTNASGYTEEYNVYRSDNANLGSTAVTVS